MNVISSTNFTGIKIDVGHPLEIKDPKVLSDEEKAAPELTFIAWEDTDYDKSIGKDGKKFEVESYYRVNGEILNKNYLDVFSSKANGEDIKYYDYYTNNFVSKITRNFSDTGSLAKDKESIIKGINELVDEIKDKNAKGISTSIDNLNTKFNVNGVDFTYKELIDTSKALDYSNSIIYSLGGMDYEQYAELGVAKGKIRTYAEKYLNEDQKNLINATMSARIQSIIDSVEYPNGSATSGSGNDKGNQFYAVKSLAVATNKGYAQKIIDTFANVDYSDVKSFNKATEEYRNLMQPVLKEACVLRSGSSYHDLVEATNYETNKLKKMYDGSYEGYNLSTEELRSKYGNYKRVNIYR